MTNKEKAFPVSTIDNYLNEGMDLRDWFAGQALTGLIQRRWKVEERGDFDVIKQWAESAYTVADAMMEARKNV